jgi:hypothetical protein
MEYLLETGANFEAKEDQGRRSYYYTTYIPARTNIDSVTRNRIFVISNNTLSFLVRRYNSLSLTRIKKY